MGMPWIVTRTIRPVGIISWFDIEPGTLVWPTFKPHPHPQLSDATIAVFEYRGYQFETLQKHAWNGYWNDTLQPTDLEFPDIRRATKEEAVNWWIERAETTCRWRVIERAWSYTVKAMPREDTIWLYRVMLSTRFVDTDPNAYDHAHRMAERKLRLSLSKWFDAGCPEPQTQTETTENTPATAQAAHQTKAQTDHAATGTGGA